MALLLNALFAILALLMLARHGPRAYVLYRRNEPGDRAAAVVHLLNCGISLVVLVVAVLIVRTVVSVSHGGPP